MRVPLPAPNGAGFFEHKILHLRGLKFFRNSLCYKNEKFGVKPLAFPADFWFRYVFVAATKTIKIS